MTGQLCHWRHRGRSAALNAGLQSVIGQPAPDFAFHDLDGHRHTLSEYRGRIVLLNIWTTSCAPGVHEMPDLSALQDRLADRGLVLVLLAPDEAPAVARFFSSHPTSGVKATIPAAERAPDFYHAYEAWPITFLIDRSGRVIDNWLGAPPPGSLRQRVESRL